LFVVPSGVDSFLGVAFWLWVHNGLADKEAQPSHRRINVRAKKVVGMAL
jgi:hypothetical protein